MTPFSRIYVEISNVCNLKCSFCPEVERTKKVMSASAFAEVAQRIESATVEVCLHLMGEPLGHPELDRIVDICEQKQLPINLTTNGVLLSVARRDLLMRQVFRQVNISLHSFEANFGEQDCTPYLKKVFTFTREAFSRRPDLYINFRLWDLTDTKTLTEKNKLIRASIEKEFEFRFADLQIDLKRKKSHRIVNRLYLHFDSRFEWPEPTQELRSTVGTCHGLSHHIGIHADGTVVPCCLDKEARLSLGNIFDQRLEDIIASPRARRMREGFANRKLVEDLCQRCDYIKRFD
jgi:radical SAM protein with 4Fe4S-binding SPASM domain